ncbi:MAG TPA: folate-binding protein [Chroococcidiopsis sp.]
MSQALREIQAAAGASFITSDPGSVPASFGNEAIATAALHNGVALCDRSHWGRLQVSDADRQRYLHNQTTNDIQTLKPGQGCDTVFVTSTGRTIDLVTAYVLDDSVLLLTSPNRRQALMQWMDRFIFFADKVAIADLTDTTVAFSLIGPQSQALLTQLGATHLGTDYASHAIAILGAGEAAAGETTGVETRIAVGSGLATPGYTLIASAADAATLWQTLTQAGAVPFGETLWEQLRIEQGRPAPDHELTEDVNPLEAGLWHTISLSKGCYIGQETIARLHTYRGVKQQLWGIALAAPVAPDSLIVANDEKVGTLTSCIQTPDGVLGLGYIRTKAIAAGLTTVTVADQPGTLVALPFISHDYL